MLTIEEYIQALANLKHTVTNQDFIVERSDYSLIASLARQTLRNIAFTDRQFELAKRKVQEYEEQFTSKGITLENINNLSMPLREIDRSKYITIVNTSDVRIVSESEKENWKWIKIRFPFSKKTIVVLEEIAYTARKFYYHEKGSHEHYFKLNEKTIYETVNAFKDKNFKIDPELLENYDKLVEMKNNKNKHIPGVYNYTLQNLNDKAIDYIISDIGKPSKDNLPLYYDRKDMYGLFHFDQEDVEETVKNLSVLSKKIIARKQNNVFVNSTEYHFNLVAESILELFRFPILVVLGNDDLEKMRLVHSAFKNIFSSDSFCALYRKDNNTEENKEFNQYIKHNNLNNPLDNDTKIVYINIDKIPKTLLQSEWKPRIVLLTTSFRLNTKLTAYTSEFDLIMHYDSEPSVFLRRDIDYI